MLEMSESKVLRKIFGSEEGASEQRKISDPRPRWSSG
jgi:hypothetical protein